MGEAERTPGPVPLGSLQSAYKAANSGESFTGSLDGTIFRVRIPRSWVRPDTTFLPEDEPEDRYVCFRRIPPERLKEVRKS